MIIVFVFLIVSTIIFIFSSWTMINALVYVEEHAMNEFDYAELDAETVQEELDNLTSAQAATFNAVFIYNVVVASSSPSSLSLTRSGGDEDRLLSHFQNGIVNTLVLPSGGHVMMLAVVTEDSNEMTFSILDSVAVISIGPQPTNTVANVGRMTTMAGVYVATPDSHDLA